MPNQGTALEETLNLTAASALTAFTTSYAAGGFQPNLTLYTGAGSYIASQGAQPPPGALADSTTGQTLDGWLTAQDLAPGTYILPLTHWNLSQSATSWVRLSCCASGSSHAKSGNQKRNYMAQDIIKEVLAVSPNRRSLLKKLAVSSAALTTAAAGGAVNLLADPATPSPTDVVQFALNLEYLEAEFYSIATTGETLEARGIDTSGTGQAGPTQTQYGKVAFANNQLFTSAVAMDIAADEIAHVKDLRAALLSNGTTPIAKPAINLDALAAAGASLANESSFLVLGRIFEDIGLSAYAGGAPLLSGSPYLPTAAHITGVEGLHVANLRLLCAVRTPAEVLYLAYGMRQGVTAGGFFPAGVNGKLKTSGAPATAKNLD